ncbi:hypothetical protein BDP27DRAFT_201288 [Rhodocollybia butyracea]|uniref:NACHT domain-containing protein n=1 Tax=Rhodocollybia butyracea TaxID=206335 RepID=A0A9P5PHL5_9AGAR|nr:hypothetical protein BDP27DRAFT_201288 [Rhodocollybia butyracea]
MKRTRRSSSVEDSTATPKRLRGSESEESNVSIFSGASNFGIHGGSFTNVARDNNITTNIHNYHGWNILKIRDWLKAPDPSTNFVAACNKKIPGTGEWILSHEHFVKWRKDKSGLLWIHGKVGSGKTFLSATIIRELQDNPTSLCCYYYFDNRDNSQTKTNAQGLIRSLLLQMAASSAGIHPALHELYMKCSQGIMEPTMADLSATLVVVSKDLGPVYLVLDAMDECNEPSDVFKYLAHARGNLCIAVTSRYVAETSYVATDSIYLHLAQDAFHDDVTKYLQDKLSHRTLKPELFKEIVDYLTEGAQGQFRWVDCQVTVLQRCKTPKAIRDALKKLPKTLEETYTAAITRTRESEHVHDAEKLLMWLVYAFESLSIIQVAEILAIDLDAQIFDPEALSLELDDGIYDILDSTLITVSQDKIVQLGHNSVKEFLTQTHAEVHMSRLFQINEPLAHSIICQMCLVYLLQFDSEKIDDFWQGYPLREYAAIHWPSHMRRLGEEIPEFKPARDLAITLLESSSQLPYVNWITIYDQHDGIDIPRWNQRDIPRKRPSSLYYMSLLGVVSCVKYLLAGDKCSVNVEGGHYGTALQAAASRGNKDIVQLLLEHNADVNTQGGHYGSALQAAAIRGIMIFACFFLSIKQMSILKGDTMEFTPGSSQ